MVKLGFTGVTNAFWFVRKIFQGFYHLWAWLTFWSCDPITLNKIFYALSVEVPYKIWFQLAKWFGRKRSLKNVKQGPMNTLVF